MPKPPFTNIDNRELAQENDDGWNEPIDRMLDFGRYE